MLRRTAQRVLSFARSEAFRSVDTMVLISDSERARVVHSEPRRADWRAARDALGRRRRSDMAVGDLFLDPLKYAALADSIDDKAECRCRRQVNE